jgi:hypothetical protein
MLYAAKCYGPRITETGLKQVTERATRAGLCTGNGGGRRPRLAVVRYLRPGLVPVLWAVPGFGDPDRQTARHPMRTAHGLGLPPAQMGTSGKQRRNDQTPHHGRSSRALCARVRRCGWPRFRLVSRLSTCGPDIGPGDGAPGAAADHARVREWPCKDSRSSSTPRPMPVPRRPVRPDRGVGAGGEDVAIGGTQMSYLSALSVTRPSGARAAGQVARPAVSGNGGVTVGYADCRSCRDINHESRCASSEWKWSRRGWSSR